MSSRRLAYFGLSTIVCITAGWLGAGCGDDDATAITTDAGSESSNDTGSSQQDSGAGSDTGSADTGTPIPEAGACAPEGSGCEINGSKTGLCKAGACTPCVDPTDDNACKTAYGSTVDGGALVCNQGDCVSGDCHTNANCTGSKICGLQAARTCGSCASDTECKTAYGADFVCNIATGGCVTNAVACGNADAGACQGTPGDICCIPSGGAAGTCAPGNCCSSAQCTDVTKPNCVNRTCTGCAAVADGNFYVDPTVVDDTAATGGPTCPFKSITRALSVLGTAQATPVRVIVKTGTTSLGALETFPLIVPVNVTVKSENTASPARVDVAAGKVGFILGSATSGLDYLVIDGQTNTATNGVVAQTGSSSATTQVTHVTVKNMLADGIVVMNAVGKTTGGGLKVGPGVVATGNGTAVARASGLLIRDNGSAIVTGDVAAAEVTKLDTNTDSGIKVVDVGQLTLTGAIGATPPTTGTVTTNGNYNAGVWIAQTPGTPPANVLTGLTAWSSSNGSGVRLFGGSSAKIRSSSLLANTKNGVHITSFISGTTVTDDTSKIDLGTTAAADPGKNVLQSPATVIVVDGGVDSGAPTPNLGAGLCVDITANKGQIVMAQGNTFVLKTGGSVDCSGATPGQISKNTTCINAVSLGVIGAAVNTNQAITLACTQ